MKKLAILAVAAGGLAFLFVSTVPQPADAGWRGKAWRLGDGLGPNVHAVPRRGVFAPRRSYRSPRGYPYAYYPYWRKRYFRGWY